MTRAASPVRAVSLGALALGLLAACGPGWAYRLEGTFERDLSVSVPVRLTVRNPHGTVRVRRGRPGWVHVVGHVTVRAPSRKRAEAWLQRIMAEPPVTQTDGDVRIEGPTWARRSWGLFGSPWGLRVDYTVDVPPETDVRITTGSGDIEVRDVDGPVRVRTGSGDVEVRSVRAAVEVGTGSGDIRIGEVRGDVDVRVGSGDVRLEAVLGRVTVRTGSGDLTVDRVEGTVEFATGSGDVTLTDIAGDLRGRTGSGDVILRVRQVPTGRTWDLKTGSGDVEVTLPQTAHFEVDAATGAGRVTVDFPLTTAAVQGRRHVRGVAGSADLRIEARVGTGSIWIRRSAESQ
jgi:hypothetical protein